MARYELIHDGREGEIELRSDGRCVTRHTLVFRAVMDSPYAESAAVIALCPVRVGSPYPHDMGAWCRKVSPRQQAYAKHVWLVTCTFSSDRETKENPLDDPADIEWASEPYPKVFHKDTDGKAIVNSAGDPYDPPIEDDDERWVVSVQKNVAGVPTWILQYRNAINSDAFTIDGLSVAAKYAKLSGLRISRWQNRNDVLYRVMSYNLHLADEPWVATALDQGFRVRNQAEPSLRVKLDVDAPVLLDGQGGELLDPSPENAVFNEHSIRRVLPFSVLPKT